MPDERVFSSEDWLNEHRLHGDLSHVPPVEFEQRYYGQINTEQHPLLGEPRLH